MSASPLATPEATLEDVARVAGVSQSTASRVLNGSTRRVRPENERRVREAAQRLGYAVDLRAQATARRASDVVVVLVDSLRDVASTQIAAGVDAWAESKGYEVTIHARPLGSPGAPETLRRLRGQRPRSIVVILPVDAALSRPVLAELTRYEEHGGLAVVIAAAPAPAGGDVADFSYETGYRGAASAFAGLG